MVIGSTGERDLARTIASAAPSVIDLTGQTTLFDIADLARVASFAVGNDTGPMHLIAAIGCPSLVLFSAASNPAHSRPRGRNVTIMQRGDLATLDVDEIYRGLPAS